MTRAWCGSFQVFNFRGVASHDGFSRREEEKKKRAKIVAKKHCRGKSAMAQRESRFSLSRQAESQRLPASATSSESVISKQRIFKRELINACYYKLCFSRAKRIFPVKTSRSQTPKFFRLVPRALLEQYQEYRCTNLKRINKPATRTKLR